jgi:hypothetical protein
MPSLHVGWNLLMGIAIFREARRLGIKLLGILMPLAMFFGIVFTANHYIIDGLAGGVLVLMSLFVVTMIPTIRGQLTRVTRRVASPASTSPGETRTSMES